MQGVHDGPCDIGVTGGLSSRCAEGDLPAAGGAALDGQEGLCNVGPARVPLDPARADYILRLEHQGCFGLQAVMDALGARVEITNHVIHTDTDAGGINTDVLDVEALGQQLDLGRLVGE